MRITKRQLEQLKEEIILPDNKIRDIAESWEVPADLYLSILTAGRCTTGEDAEQEQRKPSQVITADDVAKEAFRRGIMAGLYLYNEAAKNSLNKATESERKRGDKALSKRSRLSISQSTSSNS